MFLIHFILTQSGQIKVTEFRIYVWDILALNVYAVLDQGGKRFSE